MAQRKITVIQHNVLQWYNKCISLSNTYKILEPDIIFINSHCMPEDTTMKIPGYNIHKKNTLNIPVDCSAIAVKKNQQYKLLDNFIPTSTGNKIVSTLYQPPARDFIPTLDFIRLFRRQIPVYMVADINANHTLL